MAAVTKVMVFVEIQDVAVELVTGVVGVTVFHGGGVNPSSCTVFSPEA